MRVAPSFHYTKKKEIAMLIQYKETKFRDKTLATIGRANSIIEEYMAQGFTLTLRQLYYQFVARDWVENKQSEYKRLGCIISDARYAGLVRWDAIEDRTRFIRKNSHWESPAELIEQTSRYYREDLWRPQPNRVEVWIEKDALIGVIENVCIANDCPYFSCRGYPSSSVIWQRSQQAQSDMKKYNQDIHIIHLGDHDPSGVDMSRDNEERMRDFCVGHGFSPCQVHRIALNMDQIEEYNPPPNYAKLTDSRSKEYIKRYGDDAWELDALEPSVISHLIQSKINELRDSDLWDEAVAHQNEGKERLEEIASQLEDSE